MVKLFIGNLADCIDSDRLKNLFLEHVKVQECDVLKNYAFVHVLDEEEADIAIEKFDKYQLEGKELHVERSTSHLRKQPGMSDKCFTCGAEEHKTSQCPKNPNGRKRNIPPHDDLMPKKPKPLILPNHYSTGVPLAAVQVPQPPQFQPQQIPNWGFNVGGGNDSDQELPCPHNPELRTLYEQYLESRTRYFFYREQLSKELRLQQPASASHSLMMQNPEMNYSMVLADQPPVITRVDLTQFVRSKGQAAPIITRTIIPSNHQISATNYQIQNANPLVPAANYLGSTANAPNIPAHTTASAISATMQPATTPFTTATHAYPTSYSFGAVHYNTTPANVQRQQQPVGQPTPLSAIQPFSSAVYNLSK